MRFAGMIALGLMLASCGGASGQTTVTADKAGDDARAADVNEHHGHHHGGFTHLVIMSVETLGGTPEQHQKIEAIRADLVAKSAPVHEANKNLMVVLADALADGVATPDEATKVDAAVTQLTTAASAVHAATTDAMNRLHALLDAAQRAALVHKVESHWQVWRQANAEDDKDNNGLPDAEERRLVAMTKLLFLTTDQVDKLKAALKPGMANLPRRLNGAEIDAHVKAFGEAFVKDTFDAAALPGDSINAHLAGAGSERMAKFYVIVAPLLTVDQRTKLADHFRKHQSKGMDMPSADAK